MTTSLSVITCLRTQGKGLTLLLKVTVGMLLPQALVFSPANQYLLILILFLSFLNLQSFPKSVLWILSTNVAVAFTKHAVLTTFNLPLVLAAFMTDIALTVIIASVICGLIQGKVEYIIPSILLTNLSTALTVTLALSLLIGQTIQISSWEVLKSVLIAIFVPVILAQVTSCLKQTIQTVIRTESSDSVSIPVSFALFSHAIYIIKNSIDTLPGKSAHWQKASQSLAIGAWLSSPGLR